MAFWVGHLTESAFARWWGRGGRAASVGKGSGAGELGTRGCLIVGALICPRRERSLAGGHNWFLGEENILSGGDVGAHARPKNPPAVTAGKGGTELVCGLWFGDEAGKGN